jgi:hypothetical protein
VAIVADGWRAGPLEPASTLEPAGYEEVELVGGGDSALFACRHMPAIGARAAVVICPPTSSDAEVNRHREARLATWLARSGLIAQRFHYRGTGHSAGDPAGISFASLVDDTLRMVDHLHDRCGVDRVGFLGTRVGALVAARVARDRGGAPLALWQPVIDPRRHLDQSLAFAAGRALGGPEPARPGFLDTPLAGDLFDPAVVDNLIDLAGVWPRPVLLVQLHRRVGLAPEYRAAVGRWEARGFPVDVAYDPTEDEWWQVHPDWDPTDDVLEATTSWLVARLTGAEPT